MSSRSGHIKDTISICAILSTTPHPNAFSSSREKLQSRLLAGWSTIYTVQCTMNILWVSWPLQVKHCDKSAPSWSLATGLSTLKTIATVEGGLEPAEQGLVCQQVNRVAHSHPHDPRLWDRMTCPRLQPVYSRPETCLVAQWSLCCITHHSSPDCQGTPTPSEPDATAVCGSSSQMFHAHPAQSRQPKKRVTCKSFPLVASGEAQASDMTLAH